MDAFIVFCAKYLIVLVALGGAITIAWHPERRLKLIYTLAIALPLGYAAVRCRLLERETTSRYRNSSRTWIPERKSSWLRL